MLVADLDLGPHRRGGRRDRDPVHVLYPKTRAQQVRVAADDHALRRRFGGDHVERFTCCDSETAPLSHGEAMHARVLAQYASFGVQYLAPRASWGDASLAKVGIYKRCVVAIGNEADLLAVGLFGNRQPQLARQFPDLRLSEFA